MANTFLTNRDVVDLTNYVVLREHYPEPCAASILPEHLSWARDDWQPPPAPSRLSSGVDNETTDKRIAEIARAIAWECEYDALMEWATAPPDEWEAELRAWAEWSAKTPTHAGTRST